MPPQSATASYAFATSTALALDAAFDGGRLTSDGGVRLHIKCAVSHSACATFRTIAAPVP